MEFQAILDAVRTLPPDEQKRLVDVIQDELDADPDLTPAMIKEAMRRSAEYDANPGIAIPWAEVEASIDRRLEELGDPSEWQARI